MPEMPLGPQPGDPNNESSLPHEHSLPPRRLDIDEMCLAGDFCNYREHIGAEHQLRSSSPAWKMLRSALTRVGRFFDSGPDSSSAESVGTEHLSAFCATGGMTANGRQAVALVEGVVPSATKFGLPAGSLKYHTASPVPQIFPVEMPQVEVLNEAAGVVVSVDRDAPQGFSLALILTREAFDQALARLMKVSEFLDVQHRENLQAWTNFLPLASSIFALLLNEVRKHEAPILGVKRLVGPSRDRVFQLSVLSIEEQRRPSSLLSAEGVLVATHDIQVRQNEFGIVESRWLARNLN